MWSSGQINCFQREIIEVALSSELEIQFKASRAMKPRGTQKSRTIKFSSVHHSTDPQSDVARARSWAAIYVQDFDAPCVLQFAWISALCCALHRSTSLVIHRSGSYNITTMICLSFEPAHFFLWEKKKTARFQKGNVPINSRTSGFVGFLESGFGEGAAGRVVTPSTGGAPFSKKNTATLRAFARESFLFARRRRRLETHTLTPGVLL